MEFDINFLAVFAAAVVAMVIGALWYSPFLFGKAWMRASGMSQAAMDEAKKKGMWKAYVLNFVAGLVSAYVLSHFVAVWGAVGGSTTSADAVVLAFWLWLGFIAAVMVGAVLWENKSLTYFLINAGYWLVALVAMAVTLVLV